MSPEVQLAIIGLSLCGLCVLCGEMTSSPPQPRCYTCTTEACRPQPERDCAAMNADAAKEGHNGRLASGHIDLTGDGVPETVTRQDTTVTIIQDNRPVWQSPETWRIVDMALGDPNDDGRGEVLLAFWRDDVDGIPRSHPFIIGYRGGSYRTLWGGSAVREPVHELDLGDVDGDGTQELIVLEAYSETETTVAVWTWHGWGFSLRWRSAPGTYAGLALLPGASGGAATISVTVVP